LQEVQYICETQFAKHFESNSSATDQSAKVWAAISHDFKSVLSQLSFKADNALTLYDELPVCAKYILIAAYCASYNSPKTDKRFFLKLQIAGPRSVRKQAYTKQDQVPTGPKPFTLERLLHIYKALQELNEGHEFDPMLQKETTNHLLSQIMTFVSQKLLIKANSMSVSFPFSSLAKYRIADNVTNEFIHGLASSVNFNLSEHLERNIIKQ
jgi:origin recognition complex subunit 5